MFPAEFSSRSVAPLGFEGVCLLPLFSLVCAGSALLRGLSPVAAGGRCSSLRPLGRGFSRSARALAREVSSCAWA